MAGVRARGCCLILVVIALLLPSFIFAASNFNTTGIVDGNQGIYTNGTQRISSTGVGTFATSTTINSQTICAGDGTGCPASQTNGWKNTSGSGNVSLVNDNVNVSINTLYVDNTNRRVGIGITSPNGALDTAAGQIRAGSLAQNGGSTGTLSWRGQINTDGEDTTNPLFFGYRAGGARSTDLVRFYTDNQVTPALFINGSGNVGIGTTSPGAALHVVGIIGPDGANGKLQWQDNRWNVDKIVFRTDVNNKISADANGNWNWTVAGKNWTLSDVGNVGIGTVSPTTKLYVNGADTSTSLTSIGQVAITTNRANLAQLSIADDGASGHTWTIGSGTSAAGTLDLRDTTASGSPIRLTIDGTGNVGIGTTNPGYLLHVNGSGTTGSTGLKVQQRIAGTGKNTSIEFLTDTNGGALGYANIGAGNAANTFFITTGAETIGSGIVMDNGGNVGIGTTAPGSYRLFANASTAGDYAVKIANVDPSSTGPFGLYIDTTDTTGNLNNSDIRFALRANGNFVVTNSGKVGIGTTSPNANVDIRGSPSSSDAIRTNWSSTSTSLGNDYAHLDLINFDNATNSNYARIDFSSRNSSGTFLQGWASIAGIFTNHSSTNGELAFLTTSSGALAEKMRITSSGNVGIGTTAPVDTLSIKSTNGNALSMQGTTANRAIYERFDNTGQSFYIGIENSTGGNLITGDMPYAGVIATSNSRPLQFGVDDTPRLTILNSSGNIGIGTTSPGSILTVKKTGGTTYASSDQVRITSGTSGNRAELHLTDDITSDAFVSFLPSVTGASRYVEMTANGGTGGILVRGDGKVAINAFAAATGNTVCYDTTTVSGMNTFSTCSSLRELKTNITPLNIGTSALMQLQPVSFFDKASGEHRYGFIAQEVNSVDPVLSTFYRGNLTGVDYNGVTALLTKSVQAQQEAIGKLQIAYGRALLQNAALNTENARLREQNANLTKRVAKLEHDVDDIQQLLGIIPRHD